VELSRDILVFGELHYCIYTPLKVSVFNLTVADKAKMDAMEIWSTTWAPGLNLEGNRFWFYSLIFSLISCALQLYRLRFISAPSGTKGRLKPKINTLPWPVVRQIFTDACDLLIPGSITGWVRTSPATVGFATVASTILASEDIWHRVQAAAAANLKALGKETQVKRKGKL
jgi:hypothetical protein